MTRYMIIERFRPGCLEVVYERFAQQGRMLPAGLYYLDSWLEREGQCCFQLMKTDNPALFDLWIEKWRDLVDFEIIELGTKPTD
ncbi:MAG: DUF3303 family protein [Chloroflexota bacterium]